MKKPKYRSVKLQYCDLLLRPRSEFRVVLKVKPRDTSRKPVHSKVGELSNSAHTARSLTPLQDNEEGTGGLYTYFGCLPSLDPLSPLPPTALPQRVISSLSLLSHLISQPSVIAPQIHPSPQEKPSTREETLKHRKNK